MRIIGMAVAVPIGCSPTVDQPVVCDLASLVAQSMCVNRASVRGVMDQTIEAAITAAVIPASAGGPNLSHAPKPLVPGSSTGLHYSGKHASWPVAFSRSLSFILLLIHYEL